MTTNERDGFIAALMYAPADRLVAWTDGKLHTPAEIIAMIRADADEGAVVYAAKPERPADGGGILPSQDAINRLDGEQYGHLKDAGSIEGFTTPNKVRVRVSQGGSTEIRLVQNPDTGKVERETADNSQLAKEYRDAARREGR